ncbi:hypothetical protein DFR50_11650 [Roseiarcus fermentans]|uniref:Uncharacterized protein n=1 Tax=Roseiarcus fermentans TaxID=1473586 RepID=A0A366FB77_9HYPH|nr:hypothetical protein [Roseiarcus fermentans]RBP11356.1 hypothetical protein DFR50_11650 [Roseiarcus fermentans]
MTEGDRDVSVAVGAYDDDVKPYVDALQRSGAALTRVFESVSGAE